MLNGVLPIRFFFLASLCGLAATHQRIGKIIGRILPKLLVVAQQCLRKMIHRLGKVARLVGSRPGVEVQLVRIRQGLQSPLKFRLRLFEVARLIFLETRNGGRRGNRNPEKDCRQRALADRGRSPLPIAENQPDREQARAKTQRPLIAFNRLPGSHDSGFGLINFQNSILKNLLRCFRPERFIKSASGLGDFFKPLFIQPTLHRLAVRIPDEVRPAAFRAQRNQRTLSRTDSHREDPYSESCGPLRRGDSVGIQFLPVRQDDQGSRVPLPLSESLFGHANGFGDVRSPLRNDCGVELVERSQHRAVVQGQGSLQKRRAGKGYQAEPIAPHEAKQILRHEFRPREPAGRHIGRQHAAGGVDGDDHIPPTLFDLTLNKSHLGPRQSHRDQAEYGQDQDRLQSPAPDADRARKLRSKPRRNHPGENCSIAALRPVVESSDDRHDRQGEEPGRLGKGQGRRLHTVWERRTSDPSRTKPANKKIGKRSR